MKIIISNLIRILFWFSLIAFFNCCSFSPRNGVFTQIKKVSSTVTAYGSTDGYYHGTVTNNTLTQTFTQARDYVFNHGGIGIGGNFTVFLDYYCCFNESKSISYLKILKRDNIIVNNNIQYSKRPPSDVLQRVNDMDFTFNVTFDDPTISVPESHVYTIEFWECLGECKSNEYDKKTDKKGEIVINYSVVP